MADYYHSRTPLREGEEIQEVVRRHKGTLVLPIAITSILVIIPFFFMFYLLSNGPIGTTGFLLLLILAGLYGARVFVKYFFNVFIITNQRIIDIDRTGFFSKTVSEARYDLVSDVSYSTKGVKQTLFRTGTIQVKTQGDSVTIVIEDIGEPQKIHQLLLDLVKDHGGSQSSAPPAKGVEDGPSTDELIEEVLGDSEEVKFTKKEL